MKHAVASEQHRYQIADLEIFTAYDVGVLRQEIDVKSVSEAAF